MVRGRWERQGREQKGPDAQKDAGLAEPQERAGGQGKEEMSTPPSSPDLRGET